MSGSADHIHAALLLTNRLVDLGAKPLSAREFWQLVERVDPGELIDLDVEGIAARADVDPADAQRFRTLLDAATALSFEQERLDDGGVSLVSAFDERFPSALRERLGSVCPPFLLVAGPVELLAGPCLGVVGSRDADDVALDVATRAGSLAVDAGWSVVSGLARGVDQAAMSGALDRAGTAVGIPAEGILRAARNAEVRGRVHEGALCLASPFAPSAPFRAGNAMGRNKLIYALSRVSFVATSDKDAGGTWGGATEAIDKGFTHVAVWSGEGAGSGNEALVARGGTPITDLRRLLELDPNERPTPPRRSLF